MSPNEDKLSQKWREVLDPKFVEKQHQKNKLSARERIELLLDADTFVELEPFTESRFDQLNMKEKKIAGDGVITGFGKIGGRLVYVFSQDFSKIGGTLGEMHGSKIARLYQTARKNGKPIIGIYDSGGARIQEGVFSLDSYGEIFREQVLSSGVIPQISIMVGPCAGGASYAPGLSDFVFMVEKISFMFITGPEVIKKVTKEEISFEDLGGPLVHGRFSGCAHFVSPNEEDCFSKIKLLLSFLPSNNVENPPFRKGRFAELFEEEENLKLTEIVPLEDEKSYDIKEVIHQIFDRNSFFEIQPDFAQNIVCGFARLGGFVVGLVANQPRILAGVLDINSSDKIARFVRFCDCFNIPIINLVDCPGYLPGKDQEHNGIIRHGAKVLYAFAEASVPKLSLILRKAFGGAYIALASRALGYDKVVAWPGARIGVMGAEQAVKIIFKEELEKNPELAKEKIFEIEKMQDIFEIAKQGRIDMIIHPKDTRKTLLKLLESILDKREPKVARKHGNIPL